MDHRGAFIWVWCFIVGFTLAACEGPSNPAVETTSFQDASHSGTISTETGVVLPTFQVEQLTATPPQVLSSEPLSVYSLSTNGTVGQEGLNGFSWLSNGDEVVITSGSGIALYNLPLSSIGGEVNAVNPQMLAASTEQEKVSWVSDDNTVFVWNPGSEPTPHPLAEEPVPITSLAVAPQGDTLAYSTYDHKLKVWQENRTDTPQVWEAPTWLSNLAFSPDGSTLGGADLANFIYYIFDARSGEQVRTLEWVGSLSPNLYGAYMSPDWTNLAWVARNEVQLMNVASSELGELLSHEDYISAVSWSPNGDILATAAVVNISGDFVPAVILWDVKTGILIRTLVQEVPVQSIEFSPDGRELAVLDTTDQLKVWAVGR